MPLSFLAALAIAVAPVVLVQSLPIQDYPNHLARMHILLNHDASAALERFYEIHWAPLPNLALDLIVPELGRAMPLDWAGRAFIAMGFALTAGGAVLLHAALFQRLALWPLLAFLFLYDRLLLLGVLNYLFGLGLALVGFAAWLALHQRPTLPRIVVSSLFATVVYLAHLFAFAIYGLLVLGYELGQLLRRREDGASRATRALAIAAAQAVVPLVLFFSAPHAGGEIFFGNQLRKLYLLFSVFDDYSRPFDIASFVLVFGAYLVAWRQGLLRIAPAMVGPLLALAVAYLLAPNMVMTAASVDRRLPIAFVLVLIAATRPTEHASERLRLFAFIAAALLFVGRMTVVMQNWRQSDRLYAQVLPAFDTIPAGSRIAVAYPPSAVNLRTGATPILHVPTYAVIARDAFVPSLFAMRTQQPVRFAAGYEELAAAASPRQLWETLVLGAPAPPLLASALEQFDFVCLVDHDPFVLAQTAGLEPVWERPSFKLYRLAKPR